MCQQPGSWHMLKNAYSHMELLFSPNQGVKAWSFELGGFVLVLVGSTASTKPSSVQFRSGRDGHEPKKQETMSRSDCYVGSWALRSR